MTLSEIRKLFVKLSGRYDLVKDADSYEDDGADFFLNAGVRMLDSMFTHSKSYGTSHVKLEPNKGVYETEGMLSIEGIQVGTGKGRVTLKHVREQEILERNPDEAGSGCPIYYAIHTGIQNPALGNLKDEFMGVSFRMFPSPDSSITKAYVSGRITQLLSNSDSKNFWTVSYPETLISAAMFYIERFHRNSQGMSDHMQAIRQDLRNLDYNVIESQVGSINQMRDSWKYRGEGNEW